MKVPLHILHVEDDLNDADLARSLLEASGVSCEVHRVATEEEFKTRLKEPLLDVIISDFTMPGFNGLAALRIAREERPEVPFIFLSGTLGEETAVETLKQGASDYVLKDRMSQLSAAVRRAVRAAVELAKSKKMEERIRQQAALLDHAQDAIILKDMSQSILYWNKSAERMYGWKSRDALGRNADELLFKESMAGTANALRSLIQKGEWMGELFKVTKNNQRIMVESRWTLLKNDAGEPQSVLMIDTDITEKKQIEAQLLRTQRVETIGALTGGIAHDLNNALAPVLMCASLLREELTSQEGLRLLEMMSASARRGAEMVRQILAFSRGVGGTPEALQVQALVQEMSRMAQGTFPGTIKIETNVADDLPLVTGNATQLHQVLLNLCVNARDAMPTGGRLTIEADRIVLDEASLPRGRGLRSGTFVLIKVSDTGKGIPPELLDRIFEPFFTTKELGQGTGLGLSTVMGIVKTHGGFLDLSSELEKGTTFKVYLPAVTSAEQPTRIGPAQSS